MNSMIRGALVGLAVGDALGVSIEGTHRSYLHENPVRTMENGGTHNQPKGTWSDDSSLTFCLAESIVLCGWDLRDQATRFVRWANSGNGTDAEYWTAHGKVFDIGNTTLRAISRLSANITNNQFDVRSAGPIDEPSQSNGSLMRILPVTFFVRGLRPFEQFRHVHDSSRITHGHINCQIACGIYVQFALALLNGESPQDAYLTTKERVYAFYPQEQLQPFNRILCGDIARIDEKDIRSDGHVVHTLEASIWALLNSTSYRDAVLRAVNLGSDADTVGAITGGLAGIHYGFDSIPREWTGVLAHYEDIVGLADRLEQRCSRNALPIATNVMS